ncbi:MAG: guanine permease [Candidatus Schekmanbacteria bacterium RIFCSPLOWO2_02_FULL_38_14]|uniref:Guanine permease n=1 Tax=Candidatus Schekmanbacteria bacterium RIFCSPLOWO2_12_FULL_38_15 TaxID=1817883 RepID=A0A1F7SHN4_9BACT|nr:MAG: guanine permease [Candidatus Schekmanbacteria bacterium RIFCSPLOWO2_02_FULL_38_14]OGL53310.1 MAG: guanine permease [Candidatus Schekmanbacteria bacterium RIFCSPLOWO2_12_FULL_38_15]
MLEKIFKLKEAGTTVKTEIIAGIVTFMTLSYIIFVQPAILSNPNGPAMDFGSVMVATCIASAIATFLMGLLANYPIALAPAMGHNFFFAFTVCGSAAIGGMGYPWQVALGANFIAGAIFILISRWGLRELILTAIPDSLKHAIAVGIGLLIAFLGFEWGGLVIPSPGTFVTLGNLKTPEVILTIFGIILIASLMSLKISGALLWGIIATAVLGMPMGIVKYQGIISAPPSIKPTFLKLDILGVFTQPGFITVIFVLFLLAIFDTVGTLVGVCERAGLMKNGKLPNAQKALFSDAVGTTTGTLFGTSTITCYIESAAGVSEGGRTGLANMVTGFLMLISLFFYPLVKMIGGGYQTAKGNILYPVIAPALIIVGSMMIQSVKKINWDDPTESIPSFLTLTIMQYAFSITEGISFGFISYSFLKLISGRAKEVHWIVYVFSVLFLVRYIFLTR